MKTAQLITALKEKIAEGYADADGRLPNIGAMAVEFAVSPMTVQKAVKALVSEGVLSSTRGKGVYLNRNAARNKCVGIVTMNYCEPGVSYAAAYTGYIAPAAEMLKAAGYRLRKLDRDDLKGDPAEVRRILDSLDSMIITIGCLDSGTLPFLLEWKKPIVLIQQESFVDYPFHQVIADRDPAFAEAMEFLNDRNIENVLILNNSTFHESRIEAFLRHLKRNPHTCNAKTETLFMQKNSIDPGYLTGQELAEKVLRPNKPYDLFFSPSDFLTFGFLDFMGKHGKQYGKDYELLSYDNLEGDGYLPFEEPVITCIDKQTKLISQVAASLILNLERFPAVSSMLCKVPCRFTVRKTLIRKGIKR